MASQRRGWFCGLEPFGMKALDFLRFLPLRWESLGDEVKWFLLCRHAPIECQRVLSDGDCYVVWSPLWGQKWLRPSTPKWPKSDTRVTKATRKWLKSSSKVTFESLSGHFRGTLESLLSHFQSHFWVTFGVSKVMGLRGFQRGRPTTSFPSGLPL